VVCSFGDATKYFARSLTDFGSVTRAMTARGASFPPHRHDTIAGCSAIAAYQLPLEAIIHPAPIRKFPTEARACFMTFRQDGDLRDELRQRPNQIGGFAGQGVQHLCWHHYALRVDTICKPVLAWPRFLDIEIGICNEISTIAVRPRINVAGSIVSWTGAI